MEKFIVHFLNFSRTAFRLRAEELVNKILGLKELPMCEVLRGSLDQTVFETAVNYLADDANPRVAEKVRQFICNAHRYRERVTE